MIVSTFLYKNFARNMFCRLREIHKSEKPLYGRYRNKEYFFYFESWFLCVIVNIQILIKIVRAVFEKKSVCTHVHATEVILLNQYMYIKVVLRNKKLGTPAPQNCSKSGKRCSNFFKFLYLTLIRHLPNTRHRISPLLQ